MSNQDVTTQATAETSTSTTPPLTNSPEARTADGSLKPALSSPPSSASEPPATTPPVPPAQGAPESYADFKLPEGATLDKALLDQALPAFKEMNLSQEAAQKLVDMYSKVSIDNARKAADAVTTMRTEWRDEVMKSDLGAKIDTVKADIGKALTALDTNGQRLISPTDESAFRKAMDLTGGGDNLAVIRVLHKLSQAFTEGTHVAGRGPSEHGQRPNGRVEAPSAAQALYPTLPSSQR